MGFKPTFDANEVCPLFFPRPCLLTRAIADRTQWS